MSTVPALSHAEIWRRYDATEQRLTASLSARMIAHAALAPGMHVLDVATGRGEPAIPAAHAVGPTGSVVGIDPAAPLLAMARARADREGLTHLTLHTCAAEQLHSVTRGPFHAALCRWGLMYLDNPVQALRAVHAVLVPQGTLVVAVWTAPERVPYFALPRSVLGRFTPVAPPDVTRPGTFTYADAARLDHDLMQAGFAVAASEDVELDVMEATTDAELVEWTRAFGMNALLAPLSAAVQEHWERALVEAAAPYRHNGVVRLGGVTRVVVARKMGERRVPTVVTEGGPQPARRPKTHRRRAAQPPRR